MRLPVRSPGKSQANVNELGTFRPIYFQPVVSDGNATWGMVSL